MRKKILSLAMLSLLIISVLSVLNVVDVSADPSLVIEFAPNEITSGSIGTILPWPISTNYTGADIWGYEFSITYNPLVLEVLNVTNGGVVANKAGITSAEFQNGTIDNTLGKLEVTSAYFYFENPPPNVTSAGIDVLATVNFNVTGDGDSDIIFGPETKLIGWNNTAVETYNIIDETSPSGSMVDGYFRNMIPVHNVKVSGVWANETSVLSGEFVNVTVEIENTGNVKEKFDVTAYYSTVPIGTPETIIQPASLPPKNVSFIWDTTSARFNLSISAEASDVGSAKVAETSTTDNTFIDGTIWVSPPTLAVDPYEVINTTMLTGSFTVNITITNAYDLYMTVFNLTWNPAILTATSIVNGSFLEGAGTTVFTTTPSDTHYALINYSRTGGAAGVTGNGTLATITFEVNTKGGSLIELKPYPSWWTTYWATTPVIVSGVFTNYFDMDFQPGSYVDRGWVYPRWLNAIPQKIIVYPRNNGFLYLSYNMSIYANGTLFATENQTLVGKQHSPGNFRTYTFEYDYTGVGWGKVYMTANITQVDPEDNKPENNYESFGYLTVRITGDTDGNSDVDFDDFITFAADYGYELGDDNYNLVSEMDADGDVDFDDFIIFAAKYGYSTDNYP